MRSHDRIGAHSVILRSGQNQRNEPYQPEKGVLLLAPIEDSLSTLALLNLEQASDLTEQACISKQ